MLFRSKEKPTTPEASIKEYTTSEVIVDDQSSVHFDHGVEREAQGSSFLAYFNVVCVVAGTGALSLPYALRQGGWIGLFILFLSWMFSTYTGIILIKCLYHNGRTRLSSYQEIAQDAFGTIGSWVAFFFTFIILIGVSVLFMMLAGSNLTAICQGTSAELSMEIWTIICCAAVALPFVFFKSMKEVGFLSAFGALATVITILIVLVESIKDKKNHSNVHTDSVIWDQFPIALSSIVFSFGGNPVYAHVEAGMRRPQDWNKVVFAGLTTCVIIYLLIAVPGYAIYGNQVESPAYNSIPDGPSKIAAQIIITLHVIFACPILLTALSLDLEKLFKISSFHHSRLVEIALRMTLRIVMIVVVAAVAIEVPFFGDFLSLLGAFSNCGLVLIFPVAFYLRLTGVRNKPWYELIVCFLIVVLGIVGLIFGSKSAILNLRDDFNKTSSSS
ncbi:transmembrane amino acid transporter protein-domain-containing protein [Halteromyces radiatus]|uniref:transmembrane amino acid transporter protein-domain-containing protein n=1 Tax=Halteromyces radiatus TaxID=101107 RepID=UPI00221FE42D|nr:transmembrane amino acid transporter protein-domain-containing protein [Halteromyces radiatus]KAI8098715.1 transmembrane amino acid transporter protein-domain-containing protein [Halteromyces radiatus]